MGLHTGEPTVDGRGYVGADVHKGARIAAAGHGGQVLLSEQTARLGGDGPALVDLGEHRLKDLSAAERLFQLGGGEFPPLKTLYRTNLPVPATLFLGRESELEEIGTLLGRADVRLLTLTGPGGTGKTRLALQAAAGRAEEYPGGVFWAPLAAVRAPGLVGSAAAEALGGQGSLVEQVGDQRLLVLLDNFEHVLAAAAEVSELLRACPNVDVLVTSRELLQLAGEQVYPVQSLREPEAVALFESRARAVKPGFGGDGPALAELCRRLDHLPLALELAAARVRVFSVDELLERLAGRLDFLKAGRDADPRQATLRATIEWSYELLDDEERRVFAALGVFIGGWTLEGAEQVCEADPEALVSLVDKSLVRRRDDGRFWMLETIREFAVECLSAAGSEDGLRQRHVAFFREAAKQADAAPHGPLRARLTAALEEDVANLRAALEVARSQRDARSMLEISFAARLLLGRASPPAAVRAIVEEAEAIGVDDDALLSAGLGLAAFAAYRQGDLPAAETTAERALELARRAGDDRLVGFSLNAAAATDKERGDVERARERYAEAAPLFERLGDERALAVTAHNRGDLALQTGDYPEAIAQADKALGVFRELGDRDGESVALSNVAAAYLLLGDPVTASARAGEGVTLAVQLGDVFNGACALLVLAGAETEVGRLRRAAVLLGAAETGIATAGAEMEATERLVHGLVVAALEAEGGLAAMSAPVGR